jgi:site-specific DNA-adenine methylase
MDALSPNKSIDNLLQKLKGNKIDYKRYLGAPIRYGGGKSLAVGYIIERIPRNIKKIVSPFVGGGSVEFALNECGINVICYDIFDKLINFFNVLKNEKVKLIKTLKTFNASKQTFNNIRKEL